MEITSILLKQLQVLKTLSEILEEEKNCLIKGTWSEILNIVNQKVELQEKLHQLEQERVLKMGAMTLKEFEAEQDCEKEGLTTKYKEVCYQVIEQLKENELLTKIGYEHNQSLLTILSAQTKSQVSTYGQQGTVTGQDSITRSFISRQA